MKTIYTLITCFLVVLLSCTDLNTKAPSVRATITSQYGSQVKIRVYLEGIDGNSVTGARVIVQNPGLVVQSLGFSQVEGCYYGFYSDLVSGLYTISVNSILLEAGQETLTINHQVSNEQPTITQCSDPSPNNALLGETLEKQNIITLGWTPVQNSTVYKVTISQGAVIAWQNSTSTNSIQVPANQLLTGTYTVQVKSQSIDGDPFLVSTQTYSASESQGASLLFNVQ